MTGSGCTSAMRETAIATACSRKTPESATPLDTPKSVHTRHTRWTASAAERDPNGEIPATHPVKTRGAEVFPLDRRVVSTQSDSAAGETAEYRERPSGTVLDAKAAAPNKAWVGRDSATSAES